MGRFISIARFAGACSALALVLGSTPALADETDYPNDLAARAEADDKIVALQPISPWNIDFAENRCRLSRVFGSAEDMHLLFFEQAAPQASFGITFAGSQLSRFQPGRGLLIGMRGDVAMEELGRYNIGDVEQVGPAIIIANHEVGRLVEVEGQVQGGIDLAAAEKIDRIVLQHRERALSFETGDMMPPFQALNTCTGDLLRAWGLDQEQHASYTPPVWSNQRRIVDRIVRAYPQRALRDGEGGIFRMRVIVEADGTVSDCLIEKSTITESLESPACKEMEKARFEPALDAQGQPMRSYYATTVTYAVN